MARRTKGIRRVRRLLRNIDDIARQELSDILYVTTVKLRNLAKVRSPIRTQRLSAGIKQRVLDRTLKGRVGLITKGDQGRLFYGHVLNRGRKAQSVTAKRSKGGKLQTYRLSVPALAGRFFFPSRREASQLVQPRLQQAWANILENAAEGIGID